jgi:hypothetical protein
MAVDEALFIRKYTRLAQLAGEGLAFKNLYDQISIEAMKMLEIEWKDLTASLAAGKALGECHVKQLSYLVRGPYQNLLHPT